MSIKLERLRLIKASKYFTTCKACKLTYMAFTTRTETHCPICEPAIETAIESDEDYLANEEIVYEQITDSDMFTPLGEVQLYGN